MSVGPTGPTGPFDPNPIPTDPTAPGPTRPPAQKSWWGQFRAWLKALFGG